MYARVLNFVCRTGVTASEVTEVYHRLTDMAESADGFRGSSLLMSEDTCRGMAMMFWRDRDAAAAAGPVLLGMLDEPVYELLEHPPDIEGFEVVANNQVPSRSG